MIKLGTKVYRNIQEQVAKNTDDIAKLWRRPIFQIKVVEELPEEGEASTLYLLPEEDPEEGNYYEEYLWVDGAWELIGTTAVDISNMVTTDTDQTITGEKTFTVETKFGSFGLYPPDTNEIRLRKASADFLRIQNNLIMPYTDNNLDLGNETHKFKDLYLSSGINIGTQSTIKNDTWGTLILSCSNGEIKFNHKITPVGNSVDIGSTTYRWKDGYLSGKIEFKNPNSNILNQIYTDTYGGMIFARNGSEVMGYGGSDVRLYDKHLLPRVNNSSYDIGNSTSKWHDLYLSGNITDGTNSVSAADLAALITYAKAQGWIS